jgi:ubiquinone biosynthesis protein
MKISLKPHHLKRYKDIGLLFAKYSSPDFAREFEIGDGFMVGASEAPNGVSALPPEELANDLERMGPTFVKLGQLLSSRADLLPERYLKALARLQDKVKPFSYAEVEEIVQTELGVRLSKAFSRFDSEHLAAASLGQVHRGQRHSGMCIARRCGMAAGSSSRSNDRISASRSPETSRCWRRSPNSWTSTQRLAGAINS